jgi:enoyl-CoA hydratase/carnithine racemase
MNSPSDLNALSILMKAELVLAVKELDLNRDVKVIITSQNKVIIILSKVEKAFCAGANIKDFIGVTYEKELLDYNFREMS